MMGRNQLVGGGQIRPVARFPGYLLADRAGFESQSETGRSMGMTLLRADRLGSLDRQTRRRPGIETASEIYHIVVPSALQQAARDQAAISAFTVHRDRRLFGDLGQRRLETIKRVPVRAL